MLELIRELVEMPSAQLQETVEFVRSAGMLDTAARRYLLGFIESLPGAVVPVSETLADLDDDLLAQVAELLGTATMKDTVNRALSEYVKFRLRVSFGERLVSGELPDLADPEIMAQAWR